MKKCYNKRKRMDYGGLVNDPPDKIVNTALKNQNIDLTYTKDRRYGGLINNNEMYSTRKRYKIGGTLDSLVDAGLPMLNSVVPGLGTALSMGKNVVQGIIQQNKQNKLEEIAKQKRLNEVVASDASALSGYPSRGVEQYSFPFGGKMPYVKREEEIAMNNKYNAQQGREIPLSSDETKFVGPNHDEGGIPIDPNMDGQAEAEVEGNEVASGQKVYSDRLLVPRVLVPELRMYGINVNPNDTYAKVSEKLGRKKGMFETDLNSFDDAKKNTAKRMISRFDEALEKLFSMQEQSKPTSRYGNEQEQMAYGGRIKHRYGNVINDPINKVRPTELFVPRVVQDSMKSQEGEYVKSFATAPPMFEVNRGHYYDTNNELSSSSWSGLRLNPSYLKSKPEIQKAMLSEGFFKHPTLNSVTKSIDKIPVKTEQPKKTRDNKVLKDNKAFNFLEENQDYVANAALFANNLATVNRLRTDPRVAYASNPIYNYRDLSGQERAESARGFAAASEANRTTGGNRSNLQALHSAKLTADAATTNAEAARRISYDENFNNRRMQTSIVNANIFNTNEIARMTSQNTKLAANQQAVQAFVEGINNIRQRDFANESSMKSALIELTKANDPKIIEEMEKSMGLEKGKLIEFLFGKLSKKQIKG